MWLLCALVLSQAEPSPPPLVPFDAPIPAPGTDAPPPPPPDLGLSPAPGPGQPVQVSQAEPSYDFKRVSVTGVVAAGVTALGLTGTMLGVTACGNDGTCSAAIAVAGVPLTWVASGLGAWLVHRALDGEGSFASSMAGVSIGVGASATAWLVATSFANGNLDTGALVGLATLSSVLLGVGAGLMTELSNVRTILENREATLSVGLMPGKGGALLTLGGRF